MSNLEKVFTEQIVDTILDNENFNIGLWLCGAFEECGDCPVYENCHNMTESEFNKWLRAEVSE